MVGHFGLQHRRAALQTSEVGFWDIVPADVLPALRANKALVVDTVQPQGSWGALSPNFLFPPFNDVRARQALALMVDQRDYMEASFGNEARWRTCYAYLGCGLPHGTEVRLEPYRKQDLAKARQLMIDAGYKAETLVLLSASGNQVMTPLSYVAAAELKSIGVNVDLQLPDSATWASRSRNKSAPGPGVRWLESDGRLPERGNELSSTDQHLHRNALRRQKHRRLGLRHRGGAVTRRMGKSNRRLRTQNRAGGLASTVVGGHSNGFARPLSARDGIAHLVVGRHAGASHGVLEHPQAAIRPSYRRYSKKGVVEAT
jgi:hypothetical protein